MGGTAIYPDPLVYPDTTVYPQQGRIDQTLFVQKIEYANPTRSLFDDWLYRPLLAAIHRGARVVRTVQSGSANLYLAYILLALLLMLVLA